jgi:glycosyltransferase involved in cell wall biosynthesis
LRLLFLGNVIPRKGLHVLLEALSRLPAGSWELSVVGRLDVDQAYARRVRRVVAERGLAGGVIFSGPLDEGRLSAILSTSQLLVVPSSYEGFGIAYLEGMGFGIPAIAASSGGAAEIIHQGINGYLIEPGDWRSLAGYLGGLAEDRQLLQRLSLAARQSFAAHPTWEQSGQVVRDYLLGILEA